MELWYSLVELLPFDWAQPGGMYFMKNALLAVLVLQMDFNRSIYQIGFPLAGAGLLAVGVLALLGRPLKHLLRLCLRTGVGLAALAAFSPVGGLIGVSLGVNLANALVMGLLGVPGFGLLLMLHWALAL